jgi:UDP-N-acetylglucosamine 2-epimerase (non-hydrolysing)
MKKVLLIFGTRPEAIKMAPLLRVFQEFSQEFTVRVCVTGQHREMLRQILDFFAIKPDYDLNIMKPGQDLFSITADCLCGLKEVFDDFKPDCVLVQGDTTSTFTGALAAFYNKVPVGHIEAGLRTGNPYSPWPEETNRRMTTHLATWHFAPTEVNRQNLLREGVCPEKVIITGNTVIDSLLQVTERIKQDSQLSEKLQEQIINAGYNLKKNTGRKMILVTGHRRENFGQGFLNICSALKSLARQYPQIDIVYPVHLNPNVRKPVFAELTETGNIYLIEPLDYAPFIYLMNKSFLVLTDSGGVQEEAPSLGKPVIVMRDTTERPEAVAAGTARLAGTGVKEIFNAVNLLIEDELEYNKSACACNPYGNGKSALSIVNFLRSKL